MDPPARKHFEIENTSAFQCELQFKLAMIDVDDEDMQEYTSYAS